MGYFSDIGKGIRTTAKGLSLTLKHLWAARHTKGGMEIRDNAFFDIKEGNVTLKYPHEQLEVPENGRYQLDCEIDDCIVCDKCAKICPVDCIEIEAIKSPELIRHASDGSPVRLHAAKFNIDMAKCCFCGLCTTVCPTECLTMTDEYDFSVEDVNLLNFAFSNLSEKEAQEKRELYEQFVAEKEAAKVAAKAPAGTEGTPPSAKPVFRPKPPIAAAAAEEEQKPAFVPKAKPEAGEDNKPAFVPKAKPAFMPKAKPEVSDESKPAFVPKAKPEVSGESKPAFVPKAKPELSGESKPAFVPKAKPELIGESKSAFVPKAKPELSGESKPAFVPKAKPELSGESKPAFVPKAKPELSGESKPAFVPKARPEPAEEPKAAAPRFIPKNKPQISNPDD
ncbi:4Fe-4S dicluster domain-containing protein [Leadbetterella sp. DM7]|uniref:4Fe-4S binding protein n=1 Tax=Leadbetterella sp. DM7 TaxID=3235085 RepID=UPI00349E97D6